MAGGCSQDKKRKKKSGPEGSQSKKKKQDYTGDTEGSDWSPSSPVEPCRNARSGPGPSTSAAAQAAASKRTRRDGTPEAATSDSDTPLTLFAHLPTSQRRAEAKNLKGRRDRGVQPSASTASISANGTTPKKQSKKRRRGQKLVNCGSYELNSDGEDVEEVRRRNRRKAPEIISLVSDSDDEQPPPKKARVSRPRATSLLKSPIHIPTSSSSPSREPSPANDHWYAPHDASPFQASQNSPNLVDEPIAKPNDNSPSRKPSNTRSPSSDPVVAPTEDVLSIQPPINPLSNPPSPPKNVLAAPVEDIRILSTPPSPREGEQEESAEAYEPGQLQAKYDAMLHETLERHRGKPPPRRRRRAWIDPPTRRSFDITYSDGFQVDTIPLNTPRFFSRTVGKAWDESHLEEASVRVSTSSMFQEDGPHLHADEGQNSLTRLMAGQHGESDESGCDAAFTSPTITPGVDLGISVQSPSAVYDYEDIQPPSQEQAASMSSPERAMTEETDTFMASAGDSSEGSPEPEMASAGNGSVASWEPEVPFPVEQEEIARTLPLSPSQEAVELGGSMEVEPLPVVEHPSIDKSPSPAHAFDEVKASAEGEGAMVEALHPVKTSGAPSPSFEGIPAKTPLGGVHVDSAALPQTSPSNQLTATRSRRLVAEEVKALKERQVSKPADNKVNEVAIAFLLGMLAAVRKSNTEEESAIPPQTLSRDSSTTLTSQSADSSGPSTPTDQASLGYGADGTMKVSDTAALDEFMEMASLELAYPD